MTAGRWACARCGAKNLGAVGSCASCGLLRGSVVVSPSRTGGERSADRTEAHAPDPPEAPAASPDLPGSFELMAPLLVIGYTRARIRERGGRAAARAILVTALGMPLVVALLAWASESGREALFLPIGILGPLVLGVLAGIAIPGVAGWACAVIGSAVGGLAVGVGILVGGGLGGVDAGRGGAIGPLETLVYVGLVALLVPVLTGAQIGVGVFIGSGLAAIRRRAG